jgi:hypothetical protein
MEWAIWNTSERMSVVAMHMTDLVLQKALAIESRSLRIISSASLQTNTTKIR